MATNFWKGLLIACLWAGKLSAQEYGTGCVLDADLYKKVPLSVARGDYDDLPKAHSLRMYAPTPQNQGSYGTCVGWATAYAAHTIQIAHKQNWTNTKLITDNAFSPFFVYESAKPSSDIHCQEGTSLYNGLEILKDLGAVKVFDYPNKCGQSVSKTLERKAKQFKIKDYNRLFDRDEKDKLPFVKKSIAQNRPVVIGIQCCIGSFQDAKKQKYWQSTGVELNEKPTGGHALTVIGYTDSYEKTGDGAVELMNSWGTEWGDEGFIWMSYRDFNRFCFEGYDMTLQEAAQEHMSGTVHIELSAGESMPFYLKNGIYEAKEAYNSGTMFQLVVTNHEAMYVYAIGSDLLNRDYRIFPAQTNFSALIADKQQEVFLPSQKNFITLDNQKGTDYICLLYSTENLEMEYILNTLKNETGTLPERVYKGFGDRIFSPQEIHGSVHNKHQINFKTTAKDKKIVPIFMSIPHID